MTGGAAADPEALRRVALSVKRLWERSRVAVVASRASVQRTVEEVEGEVGSRRRALDRARGLLAQAEGALQACLRTPKASCGAEQQAVARMGALVRRCEEQLNVAMGVLRQTREVQRTVEQESRQFTTALESGVQSSLSFLNDRGQSLAGYLAVPLLTGASVTFAGESRIVAGPVGNRGGGVGLRPIGTTDLAEVPMASIDDSDSPVVGEASFDKVSLNEVRRGLAVLDEEVLPRVKAGWTRDEFRSGVEGVMSANTYDHFFGSTCIKLRRAGEGRFSVVNGYHRIFAARQMGISTLPARVR